MKQGWIEKFLSLSPKERKKRRIGGKGMEKVRYAKRKNFTLNETVKIEMSTKIAFKALFWAYLLPCIIIFSCVVTLSDFIDEGLAGLISILILLVYYSIIYLNKNYFKTKFNLTIKHI